MAFATKYSLTWVDVEDVEWKIYFQEDAWAGGVTALTPGLTPAKLTWNGGDKYQPIVGSSLDIQMVYESDIDSLHTESSQSIKVSLLRGVDTKWEGFLVPGQYFRNFNKPKHYVTLTANDGLGDLKNIKFEDGSEDPYWGLQTEIVVIANILLKTGIALDIYEFINIYDTNHNTTDSDSPLAQTYIYQEKYWNEQTGERSDCYTVLSDILKKYGATIRRGLVWIIGRPNMYSLDSADYRAFDSAGAYDSEGSSTLYDSLDADTFYIHSDQELIKIMGLGKCEVIINPPRRANIFKNGSFDAFTWTTSVPDYWTDVDSSGTNLNISASEGGIRLGSNGNAATPTEYIETSMGLIDISSATITFDWEPNYTGAPSYKNLVFQIYDGTYYLTSSGWQAGVGYYTFTAPALSTGFTFKGQIDIPAQYAYGYDRNFDLRVRIYEFHNENLAASNYVLLDNLRLEIGMELPNTRLYSYDNSITINNSREEEIALGDSWVTDFFASETDDDTYFINTYNTTPDLTSEWSITGDPTAAAPIAEVLSRQIVEGFRRSIDELSGTIRSPLWTWGTFAIEDPNMIDEYGFTKRYMPTNVTYDTKLNECNGTWVECPPTYTDDEGEWDSHDCGGDATITANSIEIDSWTAAGSGVFAYFDSYTTVVGETVRIVMELTDDGSSTMPKLQYNGNSQDRAWGTNYYTFDNSTAGEKLIRLNNIDGAATFNCTVEVTVYGITGI